MFIIYEYIKYWLRAKGLHGIHSPFITSFIKNVLNNNLEYEDQKIVDEYSDFLSNNNEQIEIEDFGAGSKKLGSVRTISEIFKIGSSKKKYGKLLYNLNKFQNGKNILEFGSSLGFGTLHLRLGHKNSDIITIEGCSNTHAFTRDNLPVQGRIQFINSTFQTFISNKIQSVENFDIVFIDGHHHGEFLKSYLDQIDCKIHENTIIILDDIRWNQSMYSTWTELIKKNKFHVSIDLFRMGILMKKNTQEKQHFVLRY